MDKIRVLIIDDEPLACDNLQVLINGYPELEVVGTCRSGSSAIRALQDQTPDLLFLDIELNDMTGFEVLRACPDHEVPVVVFVTAYDQYAIRAFEVNALDYLLKPFDDERFATAVDRALSRIRHRKFREYSKRMIDLLESIERPEDERDGQEQTDPGLPDRIAVRSTGRVYFVEVGDIDWIGAAGSYVELHVGTRIHLLRDTLTNLEMKLDPKRFLRIHRSTIVNTARIKELKPHLRGEYFVILKDGTKLKLSRSNRPKLQKILDGTL